MQVHSFWLKYAPNCSVAPDTTEGAHSTPPNPLAGKGEGKGGKGRGGKEGKRNGREGKGSEGRLPPLKFKSGCTPLVCV